MSVIANESISEFGLLESLLALAGSLTEEKISLASLTRLAAGAVSASSCAWDNFNIDVSNTPRSGSLETRSNNSEGKLVSMVIEEMRVKRDCLRSGSSSALLRESIVSLGDLQFSNFLSVDLNDNFANVIVLEIEISIDDKSSGTDEDLEMGKKGLEGFLDGDGVVSENSLASEEMSLSAFGDVCGLNNLIINSPVSNGLRDSQLVFGELLELGGLRSVLAVELGSLIFSANQRIGRLLEESSIALAKTRSTSSDNSMFVA
jgi:hypothetical protein